MLLPHLALFYTIYAIDVGNAPASPPEGPSPVVLSPNASFPTGPKGHVFAALSSNLLGDALCGGTVTPSTVSGVPWTQGLQFFGVCSPRTNYALFASLQLDRTTPPFASPNTAPSIALFITYGEFCDPAIFNPVLTNPYNYEAVAVTPTSSTTATNVQLTAFCSDQQCCAIALCLDARGCGSTTLSVTYTAPTTGPCDASNSGPFVIPSGNFLSPNIGRCTTFGKGDITRDTQSLTVSNPNNHLISVFQTGGSYCQNFFNLEGSVPSDFRFFGTAAERTTATSVSLSNPCTGGEPCCSQIWCWSQNTFGCRDVRYAVSFKQQDNPAATLAAGIIAAIVIGVVVCACVAGALAWRARAKYYVPQTTTTYTSQVVMNPASPGVQAWPQQQGQGNEASRV